MRGEEEAFSVAEFSVAKLDVGPGDVVLVKVLPPDLVDEHYADRLDGFREGIERWRQENEVEVKFLVVVGEAVDFSVVHQESEES